MIRRENTHTCRTLLYNHPTCIMDILTLTVRVGIAIRNKLHVKCCEVQVIICRYFNRNEQFGGSNIDEK